MKKILTILTIFLSLSTFGQTVENSLSDKAFQLYQKEQYDSAIFYYKEVLKLNDNSRIAYFLMQVGKCYSEKNELEHSKNYYLQCLNIPDTIERFNYPQREACFGLSDIFQVEKNYNQSLRYLKIAEAKYPHRKICNAGEFERKIILKDKFALCFEKINELDSAINYLTPYMFAKTEDLLMDSVEYIKIIENYYNLLRKKYSMCELKSLLDNAIKNVYYNKKQDNANIDSLKYNYYEVESYITFLNKKIVLMDGGYEANSWGGEPVKEFVLEYLLEYFSQTPTYKLITKN